MSGIVEELEELIRERISTKMPTQPGYLEDQSLVHLMIDYRTWRGRFVRPGPRKVHRSFEMNKSLRSARHAGVLVEIEAKLIAGEDINGHLSTRIENALGADVSPSESLQKRRDRDLLLAEWGIHHLHLSTRAHKRKRGFFERTDDVLFAVFQDSDAYLLGIYRHPEHENWAAEEVFAVLVRNWPEAGLVNESEFANGLAQDFSDEDRLALRSFGVNTGLKVDGKIYSPGGLGMSLDGTPLETVMVAQQVMWELEQCRKDPAGWLAGVQGVPSSAEWRPHLHTPVPGFVEYAGFLAGSTFVPAGRLC
jgi:hypothetical protein